MPTSDDGLSAVQRNKIRRIASVGTKERDEEGTREINVVPFLDIITNVLMFVLATVTVTFTATIDTKPPRSGPRPAAEHPLALTVLVVPDGFSVKAKGGNVATGCADVGAGVAVPKKDGTWDYDALKSCAATLKGSSPDFAAESGVTISANPQVPYDVVVATLDAVRRDEGGAELFPDVSFAVAR
jgi:biopolymer transport protein ExbD